MPCQFNDRCEAVCPDGTYDNLLDSRAECVATCPTGTITTGGSGGAPGTCVAACTYAVTTCTAGDLCPGGTPVSPECADRSAFGENPCACTALQQLAALSIEVQAEAPWSALAANAYCTSGDVVDYEYITSVPLKVTCSTVGGVLLPAWVKANTDLAGALSPSLAELRISLTRLLSGLTDKEFPLQTGLFFVTLRHLRFMPLIMFQRSGVINSKENSI